jgi:putative DNA primase/helicase
MNRDYNTPGTSMESDVTVNIPDSVNLNDTVIVNEVGFKSQISNSILLEILFSIETLDFRSALKLKTGERLRQKHVIVLTVEKVLSQALQLGFGFCKKFDFIYLFNGKYWMRIDKDEIKVFLGEAAQQLGYDRHEAKYYDFREKLLKQFLIDAIQIEKPGNPESVLINLQNGTFEITQGKGLLREFKREDIMNYQLPFEYEIDATCPKFLVFLDKVLPDENLQKVLAEFFGYVFTRHLKLEKCLLAYGNGANGKSVLFDVINAMLGEENVSNFSLSNLREEHNRALISDKFLNYGSEIKSGIAADDLKLLVSGEPIQARLKYGNSFIMRHYAKLAFNFNVFPNDVEHTNAYFRRLIIVPFEVTIPPKEQNPNLAKEIIREELPAVFNWVLKGLKRLIHQGEFTQCSKVTEIIERFKKESDSVALFIEENNYKKTSRPSITLFELYQYYKNFCTNDLYKAMGKVQFSNSLKNKEIHVARGNGGKMMVSLEPS